MFDSSVSHVQSFSKYLHHFSPDYCNNPRLVSLLFSLFLNSIVRMVLLKHKSDHVTSLLKPTQSFQFTYSKRQSISSGHPQPATSPPPYPSHFMPIFSFMALLWPHWPSCCSVNTFLASGPVHIPCLLPSSQIPAGLTPYLLQIFTCSSYATSPSLHFEIANSCLNASHLPFCLVFLHHAYHSAADHIYLVFVCLPPQTERTFFCFVH